jgi:hypothetical protein
MLVVMLSAPFKGLSKKELALLEAELRFTSMRLWVSGVACICPHLNTGGFPDDPRENYLMGYEEIARRCDAVLAAWGANSVGVQRELCAAQQRFLSLEALMQWLDAINERNKQEVRDGC